MSPPDRLTITRLGKAAGVGIETVRYDPVNLVRRIGCIEKAQALGFSLEEIVALLDLADGRNCWAVQSVNSARLAEIEAKLADLTRMQGAVAALYYRCRATGRSHPCRIIEALVEPAKAG